MENFPQQSKPETREKEAAMKNTEEFKKSVESKDPVELARAESWLKEISTNYDKYPQYDERWSDHRERELFQAYCALKDWVGAKRIFEASVKEESKEGRKKRLEELSGMKYEEI